MSGEALHRPVVGAARGAGWVAFQTIFYKEVLRFWKVSFQTVAAPVLTSVLYLLVFGHALDVRAEPFPGCATNRSSFRDW